ncbi:hypothetical protein ACH5RR_037147 [Cinchona calisaya]|uniref:Uncharacterized protein n=1 Tax=Cinchona calisaya TaxID=153742 RepID=A0ABD2YAS0_9GENT
MAIYATSAAVGYIFRLSAIRNAATRLSNQAKPSRSPFSSSSRTTSLSNRVFRSPVEVRACAESIQPFHTATASALMTSLLTVSRCSNGWLTEDASDVHEHDPILSDCKSLKQRLAQLYEAHLPETNRCADALGKNGVRINLPFLLLIDQPSAAKLLLEDDEIQLPLYSLL